MTEERKCEGCGKRLGMPHKGTFGYFPMCRKCARKKALALVKKVIRIKRGTATRQMLEGWMK